MVSRFLLRSRRLFGCFRLFWFKTVFWVGWQRRVAEEKLSNAVLAIGELLRNLALPVYLLHSDEVDALLFALPVVCD
jgi:hypothetical protein